MVPGNFLTEADVKLQKVDNPCYRLYLVIIGLTAVVLCWKLRVWAAPICPSIQGPKAQPLSQSQVDQSITICLRLRLQVNSFWFGFHRLSLKGTCHLVIQSFYSIADALNEFGADNNWDVLELHVSDFLPKAHFTPQHSESVRPQGGRGARNTVVQLCQIHVIVLETFQICNQQPEFMQSKNPFQGAHRKLDTDDLCLKRKENEEALTERNLGTFPGQETNQKHQSVLSFNTS